MSIFASTNRIFWSFVLLIFFGLLGTSAFLGWSFYQRLEKEVVERFSSHRWEVASKIYARPLLLYPGLNIDHVDLLDHLRRLDYRSVEGPVRARGDYWEAPYRGTIQLFLRESRYPGRERDAQRISLSIAERRIVAIRELDEDDEILAVEIEPEVITRLYAEAWEERRVVELYELPSLLIKALLAAEDQRFFEHRGVDFWRIMGAGWANLTAGRTVQGGSTLTQQLIKNFFLTQERTMRRKLTEVAMALIVETHYSKLQILENYLNEIYLGQRGAKSIFGVWEAARFYFGKEPRDLTVGEMAILAGMIKAPNRYAPNRHPDRARRRRNHVLRRMVEIGAITKDEALLGETENLEKREIPLERNKAPYFVDLLRKDLLKTYPSGVLTKAGLNIFSTLDMRLQETAQDVLRDELERLEQAHPGLRRDDKGEALQACIIAMQPQTGHILALVGGRNYGVSQFNRAVQAHRQPGSVFKPVVFLAALERERQQRDGWFLPTTLINDAQFTWFYEDKEWSPRNYKNKYRGMVTLREALGKSLNAATARLAQEVGLDSTRQIAARLGFTSALPAYPSLALGALEVTPYEVATAYGTLANNGFYAPTTTVKWITSRTGKVIQSQDTSIDARVHPDDAYAITHLLQGVMENGTGAGARRKGFLLPAAGKTGTTNDYGDAWFVGFTPDLLTVVWVGFDARSPLELSGGQAALPIWTEFMKRATKGKLPNRFLVPPGMKLVSVDSQTGLLASSACPNSFEAAFPKGQEPFLPCPYHEPRLRTPYKTLAIPVPAAGAEDTGPTETVNQKEREEGGAEEGVTLSGPSDKSRERRGQQKSWWKIF